MFIRYFIAIFSILLGIDGQSQRLENGSYLVYDTQVEVNYLDEEYRTMSLDIFALDSSRIAEFLSTDTLFNFLGVLDVHGRKVKLTLPFWVSHFGAGKIGEGIPDNYLKWKYKVTRNEDSYFELQKNLGKGRKIVKYGRVCTPLNSMDVRPDSIPFFAWWELIRMPDITFDLASYLKKEHSISFKHKEHLGSFQQLDSVLVLTMLDDGWNSTQEVKLGKYHKRDWITMTDRTDGSATGIMMINQGLNGEISDGFFARSIGSIRSPKVKTLNFNVEITSTYDNQELIGSWRSESIDFALFQGYEYTYVPVKEHWKYQIDFLENGTYELSLGGELWVRGDWSISPNGQTLIFCYGPFGKRTIDGYEPFQIIDGKLEIGHSFAPVVEDLRYDNARDWKVVFIRDNTDPNIRSCCTTPSENP